MRVPNIYSIKPQHSFAKWGNIFLKRCPTDTTVNKHKYTNIFPLNQHPMTWSSCEDAYEYTWTHNDDFEEDIDTENKQNIQDIEVNVTLPYPRNMKIQNHRFISDLYEIDQLKLIRSTGFCPHRRCQLGNATRGSSNTACPIGLCYTQLEVCVGLDIVYIMLYIKYTISILKLLSRIYSGYIYIYIYLYTYRKVLYHLVLVAMTNMDHSTLAIL